MPKDKFCAQCGQPSHELRLPFKHLFSEALEGFIHFDDKLFKTVAALLFRPGFLTSQFLAGKRMSYVPPIRLYVFLSFLFFLLLSFAPSRKHSAASGEAASTVGSRPTPGFSVSFFGISSKDLQNLDDRQIDSLLAARGMAQSRFKVYLAHKIARIGAGGRAEFNHWMLKSVSYMMFVLMPIFGALVLLFYRKRVDYFIDCLIFSVHFHSFAFLLSTLIVLLGWVVDSGYLILISPVILTLYCYLALKRLFKQSWWLTALKTVALGALHASALSVCFLVTTLISVLLF